MIDLESLRGVGSFFIVQADGFEELEETITDEKEFVNLQEALAVLDRSEAPIKYLKFNYEGLVYKLYPTENDREFKTVSEPILN